MFPVKKDLDDINSKISILESKLNDAVNKLVPKKNIKDMHNILGNLKSDLLDIKKSYNDKFKSLLEKEELTTKLENAKSEISDLNMSNSKLMANLSAANN